MLRRAWLFVASMSLLAVLQGCSSLDLVSAHAAGSSEKTEVAAVLRSPVAAQTKQALLDFMQKQTKFSTLALSDAQLSSQSEWVLERRRQFDNHGSLIQGRDMEQAQRFALVLQDKACWLVHRNSGQRMRLTQGGCVAAPSTP